jgi:hypothetical protein
MDTTVEELLEAVFPNLFATELCKENQQDSMQEPSGVEILGTVTTIEGHC